MPNAFVSHSSPDDRYVQEMVQYLRKLGYDEVFNDSHTIEPDELFWDRIEKGIIACDAFVVILSHASVNSYWVDREVQFARERGKKIIPVRIDDCKLPAGFDGRDVVELRQGRGDKVKLAASRITKHSPPILFGREKWLDALDAVWASPNVNVFTLVAWGGVGKTSLVAHWITDRLEAKGWPGVERYFDWSFYSQGTGESRQTSSDEFIQKALEFFDDLDPTKGSPWERGERLTASNRYNTRSAIRRLGGSEIRRWKHSFNDWQPIIRGCASSPLASI
jgi:TIR domain